MAWQRRQLSVSDSREGNKAISKAEARKWKEEINKRRKQLRKGIGGVWRRGEKRIMTSISRKHLAAKAITSC